MSASRNWSEDLFHIFIQQQIRQVAYVPDAGLMDLIERCGRSGAMRTIPLTTEEEGVALLVGAWLGGQRGALLMQSSGVGNCINMLSLPRICRIPFLMVVTMRGGEDEFNPWQVPMGQSAAELLSLAGVVPFPVEDPALVGGATETAVCTAIEQSTVAAVLISQRILGAKSFER
jgi:sulfopyruvate decarboxylase alpha subunit